VLFWKQKLNRGNLRIEGRIKIIENILEFVYFFLEFLELKLEFVAAICSRRSEQVEQDLG